MRASLPGLLASILLVPAGALAADAPAPVFSGTLDVYYGLNLNRPPDRESFTPAYGSSVRRANEFGLNLAALGAKREPGPVGFALVLQAGTAAEFVHLGEPAGGGIGHEVFRHVQQASVAWKPMQRMVREAEGLDLHIVSLELDHEAGA